MRIKRYPERLSVEGKIVVGAQKEAKKTRGRDEGENSRMGEGTGEVRD